MFEATRLSFEKEKIAGEERLKESEHKLADLQVGLLRSRVCDSPVLWRSNGWY